MTHSFRDDTIGRKVNEEEPFVGSALSSTGCNLNPWTPPIYLMGASVHGLRLSVFDEMASVGAVGDA